jgi:hypothetical protein
MQRYLLRQTFDVMAQVFQRRLDIPFFCCFAERGTGTRHCGSPSFAIREVVYEGNKKAPPHNSGRV